MVDLSPFTLHGGAVTVAERLFPAAPRPWLDLSTGINPVAYPFAPPAHDVWTGLPDETAIARLEEAAATRYGVRRDRGAQVVAAPGTQAIIQRLPDLVEGADVRILGRTYGEFERVFRAHGARVRTSGEVAALAGADVAVVVNPNNPDGRIVRDEDLLGLAPRVGHLIVDEAFADALMPADGNTALAPRMPLARLVVLRSFGKIYGLAGLRLGFAVAPPSLSERLRGLLGPWAVSGPAVAIGLQALADDQWLEDTRARLSRDGARLAHLLGAIGATPIGSTPLFRLISHPAAPALFEALARDGILIRPFAGEPHWLRFGLPGSEQDWLRLETSFTVFRQSPRRC